MKKILIVGNGGREHALAWKARQSAHVSQIFVAPGNAGTALEEGVENVPISATDLPALLDFAEQQKIDLTIIGPEAPLALGIVDLFSKHGLACFGPTQSAARLESSKVFCKNFLRDNHIPTAAYAAFTDLNAALEYLNHCVFPLVIKADGLAAGKGVIIAQDKQTANQALQDILGKHCFGEAGNQVVIESFLTGEELSFIVVANGTDAIPLATSQDHKKRDDGDLGPNTGGMGAYSPAPLATAVLQEKIMQKVIYPTLHALKKAGCPYTGFLYAGLMISPSGEPYTLEFNCRLGDPETQPILMRLKSDLVDLCTATLEGRLQEISLSWDLRPALGVVLAAKGYPDAYPKGDAIGLPDQTSANVKTFHAGTVLESDTVQSNGGRVLCVTALGDNIKDAQQKAYKVAEEVQWENKYYRKDIGFKALTKAEP